MYLAKTIQQQVLLTGQQQGCGEQVFRPLSILVRLVVGVVHGLARLATTEGRVHKVALEHVEARGDEAEGELEPGRSQRC